MAFELPPPNWLNFLCMGSFLSQFGDGNQLKMATEVN